jgi:hypothetical protein
MVALGVEGSLGMEVSHLHDSKLGSVAEQTSNAAWRGSGRTYTDGTRKRFVEAGIKMTLASIPAVYESWREK